MSSTRYISLLVALFFAAVVFDLVLATQEVERWTRSAVVLILTAAALVPLLAVRCGQLRLDRRWALLGLVPMLGFLAGIVLIFLPGRGTGRV